MIAENQLPISLLLQKNLPFAVYRLPGNKNPNLVFQLEKNVETIPFERLDINEGFAIAEFESYRSKDFFLIKPEPRGLTEKLWLTIKQMPDEDIFFKKNFEISKPEYLEMANGLISQLGMGSMKKVVLSRVIPAGFKGSFNPEKFFFLMEKSYPGAFVYLFNLPGKGAWAGATPEPLLRVSEKEAETVSLAGTKAIENIVWTEKEREEQRIVTDSIVGTLKECSIKNYSQQGPETVRAGNVAHLQTTFLIPAAELQENVGKLISKLHPTPAVCGLPKHDAFSLIVKTEKHERRFYTGFLGPLNLDKRTDLFVNLRCAELGRDKMNLYVGGGLTAASIVEDEWEETVRKSGTLLTVAEKLQTFAP